MTATNGPTGGFAITKPRLLLFASLAITWWFAHLLPNYKPMLKAEFRSRLEEARQKIPKIKVDWKPTDDPRAKYNASKLALIVEPRPIPHLVPQLLHMTSVVPPDWRFLFIGSNKSVVSVARSYAIKHQQVIGKLDLMVLPDPWEIDTKEHVFRMLTDMRFYDEFLPGVEWILKFESDSILCSNSPKSLNEWLDWSWAGAPRTPDDRFSGNGGLSLRRVSSIKRVLEFQERYNDTEAEDEWFGKRLWVMQGEKVAHGKKGVLSVEDVYIEKPMGYHIKDGGQSLSEKEKAAEEAKKAAEEEAKKAAEEEERRKKEGEEEKKKQEEDEKKKTESSARKSDSDGTSSVTSEDIDELLDEDDKSKSDDSLDPYADDADAKAKAMAAEAQSRAKAKATSVNHI
ncbi:hypothetical protein Ct61P_06503 [Colletotrichum tofieldiae]|nr:hypothetical protein Ct61P_06503 [Colletotrichum tofieldiae]